MLGHQIISLLFTEYSALGKVEYRYFIEKDSVFNHNKILLIVDDDQDIFRKGTSANAAEAMWAHIAMSATRAIQPHVLTMECVSTLRKLPTLLTTPAFVLMVCILA